MSVLGSILTSLETVLTDQFRTDNGGDFRWIEQIDVTAADIDEALAKLNREGPGLAIVFETMTPSSASEGRRQQTRSYMIAVLIIDSQEFDNTLSRAQGRGDYAGAWQTVDDIADLLQGRELSIDGTIGSETLPIQMGQVKAARLSGRSLTHAWRIPLTIETPTLAFTS